MDDLIEMLENALSVAKQKKCDGDVLVRRDSILGMSLELGIERGKLLAVGRELHQFIEWAENGDYYLSLEERELLKKALLEVGKLTHE